MKKFYLVMSLLIVLSMALTACGGGAPAPTEPAALDCASEEVFCVGFVTDTGGINDGSFNETQYAGILRAQEELGIHAAYLNSGAATDYEAHLTAFATQGYDLIAVSGFFLGADTAKVAALYPDSHFSIFDYGYPDSFGVPEGVIGRNECVPNVVGSIFKTDQAAFLAGYVGAGMAVQLDAEDPKIGYYGGAKIPTVTIFGVGAQFGMDHYNTVHGTSVKMVGWDNNTGEGLFTGDFVDLVKGRESAESVFDEGADVFMGVGGIIGIPGFDVARERGGLGIWVDTDGFLSLKGVEDVILTSIEKKMDVSNFTIVKNALEGNFPGCTNQVFDMQNGGVDMSPYHDLESKVPADLQAEVAALRAKIISGEITDTGCISFPDYCPSGLYSTP